MTRLMILTFGVLGWCWYELSGGDEFAAGDHGVTLVAAVDAVEETALKGTDRKALEDASSIELARASVGSPELLDVSKATAVTGATNRVVIQQASLDTRKQPESLATLQLVTAIAPVEKPLIQTGETDGQPVSLVLEGASGALFEPQNTKDFRVVTGSVVNMRAGPGTSYAVVDQLRRGNEVEVLDEAENGWVELRALDGSETGWMAARFLRDS
ncbi:SH3 domain-containing protein [Cognatishimia sp. F0-27]|uniref:SH3 domain-containing protein n=1 Tax=Cognatishimia sp. F0-27 TaxID=2816855 RepID=UPI001D0C6B33|nr:SH3 domain-containing protein [Cognatishimia sp. F0-27]MCC1494225.1 SH3 domain-containing protein [Cognatishimia sp. F0-27]